SLPTLLKKSGARSEMKRFRQMIRGLVAHDHLPGYSVSYDAEADMVTFYNRQPVGGGTAIETWQGHLSPEAYEDARNHAPGWDIYMLEERWRIWLGENEIEPKHPDRHFVKFCMSWYEKRGQP